jgi:hypothetical protein
MLLREYRSTRRNKNIEKTEIMKMSPEELLEEIENLEKHLKPCKNCPNNVRAEKPYIEMVEVNMPQGDNRSYSVSGLYRNSSAQNAAKRETSRIDRRVECQQLNLFSYFFIQDIEVFYHT